MKKTTIKSFAIISFRIFNKFYGNSAVENGSSPKQLPWQQEAWLLIYIFFKHVWLLILFTFKRLHVFTALIPKGCKYRP